MPKLRTIRTKEDAKDLPIDKPVDVELAPESEIEVPAQEPVEKVESPVEKKVEKPASDDSGILALQKQIEDLKKANEDNAKRAAEIDRQRQEAVRLAEQRQAEISKLGGRAEDAEFTSISNGILAHQAEIASAKQAYRAARVAENAEAEEEALDRMQEARVKLARFEDAKDALEARRTAEKERPKPQPAPQTIEQQIDNMTQLLPREREWLKKHPDAIMGDNISSLNHAHKMAEKKGYSRGSDDYFKLAEEIMGYAKPEPKVDPVEEDDETPEVVVAAPVTKSVPSPSGTRQTTRVTLTPEQLEVAKASGIDPLVYAQNYLKLQQAKKDGRLQ